MSPARVIPLSAPDKAAIRRLIENVRGEIPLEDAARAINGLSVEGLRALCAARPKDVAKTAKAALGRAKELWINAVLAARPDLVDTITAQIEQWQEAARVKLAPAPREVKAFTVSVQ